MENDFNNPYLNPQPQKNESESFEAKPTAAENVEAQNVFSGVDPSLNSEDKAYEVSVNPNNYEVVPQTQPTEDNKPYCENVNAEPMYSCEWYGSSNPSVNRTEPSPPYSTPVYTSPAEPKKAKKHRGVSKGLFFSGIAVCLCLSFIAGFAGTGLYNFLGSVKTEIKNGLTINKVEAQGSNTAYTDSGLSTVDIVSKAADSVVEITTETVTTGVFAQQFIQSGAGSGVIVDSQGYIVTNHHVIEDATKISVTLRDGTVYEAELVGSDEELDVALLEIDPELTLTAATFGDSDTLRVGERTVAIGNPLGQLGGSVTEGIISALNRDVVIDGQTMSLLQTDTAVNPGNSGGGLFNCEGNLIGIVNAKSSGSEVEGLGFAIPINDVVNVIGDLSEYGYVRGRVDLGMTFIDVDSQQLAWMYGLEETGCYVYSVDKNTNAAAAGFESGDRVISVNSTEVTTSDEVEKIIKNCAVGEEVTFRVENTKGKTYDLKFKLEEYVPVSDNENFFESNGSSNNDYSYWWSNYN